MSCTCEKLVACYDNKKSHYVTLNFSQWMNAQALLWMLAS